MAELTQEVIDLVSRINLDDDIKQDFYVKWLEAEERTFSEGDLKKFIGAVLFNILRNNWDQHKNRERLLTENEATIRSIFGYDASGDDPLDVLMAMELANEILGGLSDLEQEIYIEALFEGSSYTDLAEKFNMTEEAVRKHVSRIKGKFNGKTHNEKPTTETENYSAGD